MRKMIALLLSVCAAFGLAACGPAEPKPDPDAEISALDIANPEHVGRLGRTYYDEDEELLYFNYTASGFEVRFRGSQLEIDLVATEYASDVNRPVVTLTVDGQSPEEGSVWAPMEELRTIEVENLDPEAIHTVRLQKRSEAAMSKTALKALRTDGSFILANAPTARLIEVYGDSVTCGYGNRAATMGEAFSTLTEDGLATYAALAADAAGAELSVLAASGWAIYQNVWNSPRTIPDLMSYADFYSEREWSGRSPDVVVIAGGANDSTWILQASGEERSSRAKAFQDRYAQFIRDLRTRYPGVKIICCYGMMGEAGTMYENIGLAMEQAGMDGNLSILELPALNTVDGIGAGHPSAATHARAAALLEARIREMTGWND